MDFNEMTIEQIENLIDNAKEVLKAKKKEALAARKVAGLDIVKNADGTPLPEGTMVEFIRAGNRITAPLVKVNATTATFLVEGKKVPVQGQLIVGIVG